MPITLPNLDDRRYADLLEEALARIPVHAPEWTNYNASDPGITLIEVMAYLTEMLIYRLDRVTVENVVTFLNLIDEGEIKGQGPDQRRSPRSADDYRDPAKLTDEVRKVVTELRKPYRAVTRNDFNRLVIENFAEKESPEVGTGSDSDRVSPVSQKLARAFTTTLKDKRAPDGMMVDFINVFVVPVLRSVVLIKSKEEFSDYSSNLEKPGHIPFRLVSTDDEYLYIGMKSTFDAVRFSLNATVSGYELKFEYSKGDKGDKGVDWAELTEKKDKLMDLTSNWSSSGLVVFEPPADWQPATVNKMTMYWLQVSAVSKTGSVKAEASAFQVAVQTVPALQVDESEESLLKRIKADLDTRKLLATRLSVTGAQYKRVAVHMSLHLKHDALGPNVVKAAREELSRFFHPLIGWRDGKGWPFGRDVYLSEIIERLAGLPGVDYVESAANPFIDPNTGEELQKADKSIQLEPFELVDFRIIESKFKTVAAPDPRAG